MLAGGLADISKIGNFYLRFGKSCSGEIEGKSRPSKFVSVIHFKIRPYVFDSLQASIVTAVDIGKRDFSVEPPGMGLRRATEVTMRSGNRTPIGFWHCLFD